MCLSICLWEWPCDLSAMCLEARRGHQTCRAAFPCIVNSLILVSVANPFRILWKSGTVDTWFIFLTLKICCEEILNLQQVMIFYPLFIWPFKITSFRKTLPIYIDSPILQCFHSVLFTVRNTQINTLCFFR